MTDPLIVSREEWELMLMRSRRLLDEAEYYRRRGCVTKVAATWGELTPLNRKIGNPRLLRVRGIDG